MDISYVEMHDGELSGLALHGGSDVALTLAWIGAFVASGVERYKVSLWTAEVTLSHVKRIALEGPILEDDYIMSDFVVDASGREIEWADCFSEHPVSSIRLEFFSGATLSIEAGTARVRLVAKQEDRPDWEGPLRQSS